MIKRIRDTFSFVLPVFGLVLNPIWNSANRLRLVSNFLLAIAAIFFIFWGFVWISYQPIFSLTHVTVESMGPTALRHVNLPTIKARAAEKLKGNFFDIRLDQARESLEAMPWVRRASVRRVWPNGLVIAIEEHKAIAVWGGQETPHLMNAYGEVFIANMAEAEDGGSLLKLSGPVGSNREVFQKLQLLNNWFKPFKSEVAALDLSSRYAWKVKLSNGLVIDLGRELDERDSKQIELAVDRLLATWPQVEEKWAHRIDSIDLRYPNGYAIHLGKKL